MDFRCFKKDCKLEALYFCKCLLSDLYCCESHLKLFNRSYAFDSIFVEPCQETKNVILGFLTKKKFKREKLRESILAFGSQNLDNSREITKEALKNLDSDIEEISGWIEKITQTQKIAKKEQDSLLNLLILQPNNALESLRKMIPATSDKHNSVRQLYWLNELRAKTSDFWNRFNSSEFSQDFMKTCELYEKEIPDPIPLVKQAYQEYVWAYYQTKSIYSTSTDKQLFVYDTEKEQEGKKYIENINHQWGYYLTPISVQLPNGEFFVSAGLINDEWGNYSWDIFIIDRNYRLQWLPSHFRNPVPLIYFNRSVYCIINDHLMLRFDLDENRWIYLSDIKIKKSLGNSVIFNRNILIAGNGHLWLYSIEIDSLSIIPYNEWNMQIEGEDDSFTEYSNDSSNTLVYKSTWVIKAEERLYLIEIFIKSVFIYESEIEDEYTWKQISKTISDNSDLVYCLYNKRMIYFSYMDPNHRQYYKFDLDQMAFIEVSYYFDIISLKQRGEKLKTIECYCQTFEFDPDYAAAYISKGKTLYDLGSALNQIEYETQGISQHANFESYYWKGDYFMDLGMYLEAIECFNESVKFKPQECYKSIYDSYCNSGDAFRKLGRSLEAIECYNYALKMDPKNNYALCIKGNIFLYDLRRSLEAIKCYNEAIKRGYHWAYYHKGNALLYDLGENLEALKCYNNAIYRYYELGGWDDNEYISKVYNNKGYVLNMRGRSLEAIECYNQAIKEYSIDAIVYNNKGDALNALGRNCEAIECYNKAIQLESGDFLLFCNRGRVFNDLEWEADALEDFNTAYNLIQESYSSDSIKKKIIEWNRNFFNDELRKGCIELIKTLFQLQEYAIEFKDEFLSLKNAALNNSEQINTIEMRKKYIKKQMSRFITRVIEFLGSNNHETLEELKQYLYKLEKEAYDYEKQIKANISDLKSLLIGK